jgi:hypothetical protein
MQRKKRHTASSRRRERRLASAKTYGKVAAPSSEAIAGAVISRAYEPDIAVDGVPLQAWLEEHQAVIPSPILTRDDRFENGILAADTNSTFFETTRTADSNKSPRTRALVWV